MIDAPAITALAPWFGSARMLASEVGELLKGCRWVGIPFAGGMPEVCEINALTIVVSDLHTHIINLAKCLKSPVLGPRLYRELRRVPFCGEILAESQTWLKLNPCAPRPFDAEAAYHYFIACWMGRSGKSGIDDEFNGSIAVRWNTNGGDSVRRFQSAVRSITAWRRILLRVTLVVMDCFEFLDACRDEAGHGIYCDPPFPDTGEKYRHKFTDAHHAKLAARLGEFRRARVVCRFYDHPLIRSLYPESCWQWHRFTGRKQSNAVAEELLLTNGEGGRLFL